jgi:prolyl 4-hydroxylase
LTPEWLTWIDDNLVRGCTAQSIVEALVKSNVASGLAQAAVDQAAKRQARSPQKTGALMPDAYVYQTPRLPQTGNVIRTHDRDVRVSLRLSKPVIAVFDNLLSAQECDELVRLSGIKLKRSGVIDPKTGEIVVVDARSSFGTFFYRDESAFITGLDRRIAEVMHWPEENGEGIQVLNYQVGAEYKAHYDYFPPDDPGSQAHLSKSGQRVSTLVMYLNDVAEGGETTFPELHLAITPKKGSAAYFEYTNTLGQVNPLTFHSGVPVVKGEKWIATKWMRQRRYG